MPKTPSSQATPSALDVRLAGVKREQESSGPLWKGPSAEGPFGGITFSMLSRFLTCRERFRVQYIEGIKPVERFNHRTDYGTMWHLCEEALARGTDKNNRRDQWADLGEYCLELQKKFPMDRAEIEKWYMVCRTQFPIYVEYWSKHDDVKKRTPLMQEQVFDVPYKLPSGRVVRLRGKFDSVDLIDGGVWLQENKTKGDVDVQQIQRQLTFDLQTMMYLVALGEHVKQNITQVKPIKDGREYWGSSPIKGVRYNVVRRPLSGGKGTIQRSEGTKGSKCPKCKGVGIVGRSKFTLEIETCPKCKGAQRINAKPAESWDDYYKRLEQVIRDDPGHFFARWKTEILPADIARFRRECLDPILEQLCDWYDSISWFKPFHGGSMQKPTPGRGVIQGMHWRTPFGVNFEALNDYGGDTDAYIENGSLAGLRKVTTLFEELA